MQCERRQFARKRDSARNRGPVQGLFAETIAREVQTPRLAVDDGESKHAVQSFRQAMTPRLIPMNEYLGVGVARLKDVTELNEFVTQLEVVIDLTVEDDPDRSILIPHRLITTGNINDRQAPVAEMHAKLF